MEKEEGVTMKHDSAEIAKKFALMQTFRSANKFHDVILNADDKSYPAHRIILAASIPYFEMMFDHDWSENQSKNITIQNVESCVLEIFLKYAYGEQFDIDENNVSNILLGSVFFLVDKVRDTCIEFLKKKLCNTNCLSIKRLAVSVGCKELEEEADNKLCCFSRFTLSEEFPFMELDEIINLIIRDDLRIYAEESVVEACISWVKHNEEERTEFLPTLLKYICFPFISSKYINHIITHEKLINSSVKCLQLLKKAKTYHLWPDQKPFIESFAMNRIIRNTEIFLIGGERDKNSLDDKTFKTFDVYDSYTNSWTCGKELPNPRQFHCAAVIGDKVYAFVEIDYETKNAVEIFDPIENKWLEGPKIIEKRIGAAIAELNSYMYICGGIDGVYLNKVSRYCLKTGACTEVAPMQYPRSDLRVVTLGGYLYALGGKYDSRPYTKLAERYDPATDCWTKICPMRYDRFNFGAVVLNELIYVCGGDRASPYTELRSVEVYNSYTDSWRLVCPMNFKRKHIAVTAFKGKLWVFGGIDGPLKLSTVEIYDPEKNMWSLGEPLENGRSRAVAVVYPSQ